MFEATAKEVKTVYDYKGQMYAYEGEQVNGKYVVYPVFRVWRGYQDEPPVEEIGDLTLLNKIFEKPPVQRKAEEVENLEKRLQELKDKIKEQEFKLNEIQSLKDKTPEQILEEKLKDIPNGVFLMKALTNEFPMWHVNMYNYGLPIINNRNWGVVGVKLSDGSLKAFKPVDDDSYSEKYVPAEIYTKDVYKTEEEAVKAALVKINRGEHNPLDYERYKNLGDLLDKYGIEKSETFIRKMKHAFDEKISKKKEDIKRSENELMREKQRLEIYKKDLEEMENIKNTL